MCRTCVDLLGFTLCPPWRATREPDFDADLQRERDVHEGARRASSARSATIDATTGLVLHARLSTRDDH